MGVGLIIVGVISLILAILCVIFITPRSRAPYLSSFGQWLHRILNFDSLLIEKILKFIYILLTVFAVLFGFFMPISSSIQHESITSSDRASMISANSMLIDMICIFVITVCGKIADYDLKLGVLSCAFLLLVALIEYIRSMKK